MVESTEDLQASIQAFNSLPDEERQEVVVLSMDAKALFPSIEIDRSAEVVYELMMESEIVYGNICDDEMTRYAAVVFDNDTIQKYGLQDYVMRRKSNHGVKPTVVGREMEDPWSPKSSSWLKPAKPLNDYMRRKMLSALVSEEIRFVMKRHLFRFGEKFYKQMDGGSIGSVLTGEVSKARTIVFMRKLKMECVRLRLNLYMAKIFVDDVLALLRFPGMGFILRDKQLVWDPAQQTRDTGVAHDVIAAHLLVRIANSIENESDIQMI